MKERVEGNVRDEGNLAIKVRATYFAALETKDLYTWTD